LAKTSGRRDSNSVHFGEHLLYTQRVGNGTRHHPPTCATDFESDAYTSFIPLE
jgi:hypothetical protein